MLTDLVIRKLPVPDKLYEERDGRIAGLFLACHSSGHRSWVLRYRVAGKPTKLTLGSYPGVGIAAARAAAQKALGDIATGSNPAGEKRAAREARKVVAEAKTVQAVADEFLKRHTAEKNGARWAVETRRILDKNILPVIGAKPVASIGRADINDMLDPIADRGAPIAANRALAVARKLFAWALSRGYVDRNPCDGVAKPGSETKRDRVLSDDELALVWRAADGIGYPFGPIVKMLILTGARRDEVGAMTWAEVDLAGRLWTLPAERAKNGVAHEIPLSDSALKILESLPRIGEKPTFVFTTTGMTPVSGWSRAKTSLDAAILKAMRKDDPEARPLPDWRVHDLRRTVATDMAGLGVALPVVEKILNHTSGSFGGVAGVYQRFAFSNEKRAALDAWARRLDAIVSGTEESNVVALAAVRG